MTDDDILLARCLRGERGAFEALYRRYFASTYRICKRLIGDAAEAEDLTQKVFIEVYRKLGRFERRSRLSTWIYGFAVRLASNVRRGRRRRLHFLDVVRAESSEGDVDAGARSEARSTLAYVDRLLAALPEAQRTAFLLHYGEGLVIAEVAEIMSASPKTTFARIHAARQRLLARIEETTS